MNKTITVLVPVYNMKHYLQTCFDSILAQTYSDIELLIIDDGSNDGSELICDEYQKKDRRVRVIHTSNQGHGMARNTGLDHISTDYIAMIDADDCVNCHYLEILMDVMEKTDADMVFSQSHAFHNDDEISVFSEIPESEVEFEVLSSKEYMTRICKKYTPRLVVPHKLYKTKVFHGVRYSSLRVNLDEWAIHHLVLNCNRIAIVNAKLYYYRASPEGMTRIFSAKKISGVFAMLDRIKTLKENHFDELVPCLYERLYEITERFFWDCKKHNVQVPKELSSVKPELQAAFQTVISKQTDVYSRKEMLVKWMFSRNFWLYEQLSYLFKTVKK